MKTIDILNDKKIRKFTILGLLVYIAFFIFGIIFKFQYKLPEIRDEAVNLITFSLIKDIEKIKKGHYIVIAVQTVNIFINILLFIPLSIYLSLFEPKYSKFKRILLLTILSVLIEAIQLICKIGVCDVFDVLLNSIGAIIGVFIFDKIVETKEKATITKLIKILNTTSILFLIIAIIAAFYTTFVIGTYWGKYE